MFKKIAINFFITFILMFIIHNVFPIFKNNITAIFFPVNESVWEHMKMLFTGILLTGFINYCFFKTKNNSLSSLIVGIISIIIYLVCFLPFNSDNKILIFSILIIDIIICEIIRYFLIKKEVFYKYNNLAFILIIICYIIFGYLTYKPPICDLFKDKTKNMYGINTHEI